jgi:hypothetical protein
MSLKRIGILASCALVVWALMAQAALAATYSLAPGSGGQVHIGNGLALPIQQAVPNLGAVFPNLLIPPVGGATVMGTTVNTVQQKLTVPAAVLSKPGGVQTTVGVNFSNPTVYAVGTNLKYTWPVAAATLSTGARTGAKTVVFTPVPFLTIAYSNPLSSKFGGPAQFRFSAGAGGGGFLTAPVTVYIAAFGGAAPCTHPTFGGTGSANNLACKAMLAKALPSSAKSTGGGQTGYQAIGGPAGTSIKTPGGAVGANGVIGLKLGGATPGPKGTVLNAKIVAGNAVIDNMATSFGYPWTTGKIVIKAAQPAGAPETFTLTGNDNRTAMGAGTIQLVAGSLSLRVTSMDNANRGWIRLVLDDTTAKVPALSAPMRAAAAAFMLLVFGYALRRFATR